MKEGSRRVRWGWVEKNMKESYKVVRSSHEK